MKNKKKTPIRLLLEVAKPGKVRLTLSAVLMFLSSICSLGPFYVAYVIIEKIINPPLVLGELFRLGAIAGLFLLGQLVFSGIAMAQSHVAAYDILYKLRVRLADKMLKLPLGYFSKTTSGEIKKIMMADIEAIEEFVAHNLVDLFSVIFVPLLIFGWLLTFNVPLALISVAPVFLGVLLQQYRQKRDGEDFRNFFKLKGRMNTTIIDFIRGMPVIKAFNQSVYSFKTYREEAENYSDFWIGMNKRAAGCMVLYALLMDSGILFLLPIGGFMYLYGLITLDSFLMFMFLGLGLTRFMKQLMSFGSNINQISRGVINLNRVLAAEEAESAGVVEQVEDYSLEFRNVSFGYEEKRVLNHIDLVTKQGTITALVGSSGAGKSTLGQLIPRFWDVDEGEITIGGVNIKDIKSDVLMKNVSFVFQDVFMFNDSILENIRMGDESISREDVMKIAQKAQCHDFIMALKDGYDTQLGAEGTYLSGGEKQRISIARALVKDSPLIILDEATSYSDTENEAKIQTALSALLENKTVLIIAHRLSTIQSADQILVFDKGEIVERGVHSDLIARNGLYKSMWDKHIDAGEWGIGNRTKTNKEVMV
ncbi:MAG: ABC transporter ATP-binding protein [Spirochaetales bacterium]|nr:ABC transporter ATP-binding protein [Spirochaetales bacterium]